MVDAKKLGKRIQSARNKKGLTGEQLSENINISLGFLREIERGGKKPSLDTLVAIANELEVSADELLCDSVSGAQSAILSGIANRINGLPSEQILFIEKMVDSMINAFQTE